MPPVARRLARLTLAQVAHPHAMLTAAAPASGVRRRSATSPAAPPPVPPAKRFGKPGGDAACGLCVKRGTAAAAALNHIVAMPVCSATGLLHNYSITMHCPTLLLPGRRASFHASGWSGGSKKRQRKTLSWGRAPGTGGRSPSACRALRGSNRGLKKSRAGSGPCWELAMLRRCDQSVVEQGGLCCAVSTTAFGVWVRKPHSESDSAQGRSGTATWWATHAWHPGFTMNPEKVAFWCMHIKTPS